MRNILADYPGITFNYLKIAEGGFFVAPTAVQTVLGSCVAVTMCCPDLKIGGTFHGFLPSMAGYEKNNANSSPFKYLDTGVDALVEQFLRAGIRQSRIEAKVFGGGNVMLDGELNIGLKNVEAAFQALEHHRIRITVTNIGGGYGRKLIFISSTGEVFIKRLQRTLDGK